MNKSNEKQVINQNRRNQTNPHDIHPDVREITYIDREGEVITEDFFFDHEDMHIWCIPSELKLLNGATVNMDGTFRHSNIMYRKVGNQKTTY